MEIRSADIETRRLWLARQRGATIDRSLSSAPVTADESGTRVPAFDPMRVTIRKVGPGVPSEILDTNGQPVLRNFDDFHRFIRSQLDAPDEGLGRHYQLAAVNSGYLEIVSPFSGLPVRSTESFLALDKTFYRFFESEEFYVAAGRIRFGYPLVALFVPGSNLLVGWEIKRGIETVHLVELARVLAHLRLQPAPMISRRVTIMIGHKNFAHHMWNELPALERLLGVIAHEAIPEVLAIREPLGPIDKLFPEIADWKIERLNGRLPAIANERGGLLVNLGSFFVTSSVRKRVVSHALSTASAKARKLEQELRALSAPVFWVSVRTQTPTVINQREALAELGSRILRDFPACTVLFDGFSLPNDWDRSEEAEIEFYRAAARDSKEEIDATIAEITGRRTPLASQRFVNLGGWGILDCITIARLATCYFCHVGTIQHKIGWTTDVPGMIHANRRIISLKAPVWYAPSRLEVGMIPETIPASMVTSARRESDYKILDTIGVADAVCDYFRRCVLKMEKAHRTGSRPCRRD